MRDYMLNFLNEAKRLLTLYHMTNMVLMAAFYLSKVVTPICQVLYPNRACYIELREYEIFLFLGVVVMIKNRKATSWMHYMSTMFTFFKIGNLFLFYINDPRCAVVFGIACILQMVLFPEPSYTGPEAITYFRGPFLWDEIHRDTRITWMVEFYAAWSPPCVHLHPVFAQLSTKYALPNLKFGKLDVGRFPKEAERFRINVQTLSKQLPTVILFEDGVEKVRRPIVDQNRRCLPYIFAQERIIIDYDLNNLYQECKKRLPKGSAEEKLAGNKKMD